MKERQKERKTKRKKERRKERKKERKKDGKIERQKERKKVGKIERQKERKKEKWKDRKKERKKERKQERKLERQKDRKKERNSKAVSLCLSHAASLRQLPFNRQLINWSGSGGGEQAASGAQVDQLKQLRRFLTERCVQFSGRITQIGNPTRFAVHIRLHPKMFALIYFPVFCESPLQCNIWTPVPIFSRPSGRIFNITCFIN